MPRMVMHREPVVVFVAESQSHRSFVRGLEIDDDDPAARDASLEWLFVDDAGDGSRIDAIRVDVPLADAIEQATAAPGERRSTRRARGESPAL